MTRKNAQQGFTLVETLVATFVLVTAIVAPLTMVSKGVFFSNYARDQVTASFLAQEAIELLRNTRDNATIAGTSWQTWKTSTLGSCLTSQNQYGCYFDSSVNPMTIGACGSGGCGPLSVNTVTGVYGYQTGANWAATPYERRIKVYNEPTSDANANELRVEVEILWSQGTISKTFVARENIFNWQ